MRGSIGVVLALVVGLAVPADAAKRLTVTVSRAEVLYAQSQSPNCTDLSTTPDAELPLHIVRLRATPPVGVAP